MASQAAGQRARPMFHRQRHDVRRGDRDAVRLYRRVGRRRRQARPRREKSGRVVRGRSHAHAPRRSRRREARLGAHARDVSGDASARARDSNRVAHARRGGGSNAAVVRSRGDEREDAVGDGSAGTRGARARAVPGQVGQSRQHVRRQDARRGAARDARRNCPKRRGRRRSAAVGAPARWERRRWGCRRGRDGRRTAQARVQTRERRGDAAALRPRSPLRDAESARLVRHPERARWRGAGVCGVGDSAGDSGRRVAALTRTRPGVRETRGGRHAGVQLAPTGRRVGDVRRVVAFVALFGTSVGEDVQKTKVSFEDRGVKRGVKRVGRGLVRLERRRRECTAGAARLLAVHA
mmetsp:Transcript_8749/g.34366  ORF Transcript_8749/g.34366 Transcript_8749/m.34366 type:complete len:351 (-) Transcript_8749:448-1500(-)